MPSIKFDAIIETAKVVSGFRDIQNAVRQTAERVEKEGKTIDDVISNIQNSFNIAIGGWSVGKFVNQMMQVRGQFQQTEMAFKTMLQSEEKANELMKQMIHTAAITPFGVEDVTEGAKQLLAFNVAAEDVNKTLIGLGDVAAGMGLNLSDLVMLYGTTIAKGKMDTQDLYQFLNRGIPIADEVAKVMGLDVSNAIKEVQKQIKAGKVTSDIFIQAMQSMTSEGSKFGGLMEAQSKTISGQISNIEDGIEQMFNELGKSQEGVINTGLDIVSKLVDNWESVGKVLLTVVSAYGAYKAAVLTMIAISKTQIALNTAVRFIKLASAVTNATQAMRVFNLACSSNALGLVLGVVAAGVTAFGLFGNTTEDAAAKTTKFTESASEASGKVESLVAILKTAKKGSKVYKDTIKELSTIYGNYGITIDKIKDDESNLIDVKQQEIDKSNELIEQIKLETTERNRANAISAANEEYNNRIEAAQQNLQKRLENYGTSASAMAVGIENIVSDKAIERLEALQEKMGGLDQHSKEYQAALREYNSMIGSLLDKAHSLAESFGYTGTKTYDAHKALASYLSAVRSAKKEHAEETENVNKAADATENFGDKTASTADRIKALEKQLQGAGEDVHTLYNKVKAFMENYSENDINFHVNFDAKIPSWMNKMDIPELGRLGRYFSALAKDLANNKKAGAIVNGKWMSRDSIAQRGWDYTSAANIKQTKVDEEKKRKQRQKEEDEANAKKKKKEADAAKKEAEKQRKAQEELNEDQKQFVQQNIDTEISLMKEGTEKKIAEIKNDYKKRLAEIDKQEAEFKKKNKEAGKKGDLTKEQSDALSQARKLAEQSYGKQMEDINKETLSAMRDYLKEYGSLYQQKQAITEEYEAKISKAQTEGERLSLQQQKKKALSNFDYESISMGIDWKGLLSGIGSMSKEMLQPMMDKLNAYVQTDEFRNAGTETQQKVVDLMQELRKYLGTDQSATWEALSSSIVDFNKAVADYQKAVQEEKRLKAYYDSIKAAHDSGSISDEAYNEAARAADNASRTVVDAKDEMETLGTQLNANAEAVQNYTSGLTVALNNLGTWKGASGFSNIQSAVGNIDELKGSLDSSLSTMGDSAAKTIGTKLSSTLGSTLSSVGSGISSVLSKGLGSVIGIIAQIPKLFLSIVDAIKNFITGIINAISEILKFEWLSDLVDSILEAIGNLIDTIFDLPENIYKALESIVVKGIGGLLDTVLGRVFNVLTFGALSSKGPSDWFTNSNAEEIADKREELIEEAEKLTKSIDSLKNELSNQSGAKAISTAAELKQQQEQLIANAMKQIVNENEYHDAHHSNASYWNENALEVYDHGSWAEITKALQEYKKKNPNAGTKTDTASSYQDLQQLTPEQMNYIRTYYKDQWQAIKDVGKYDASDEKWEAYADLAGTLQETVDELNEALTQTSFDSLKDEFISTLMDMDSSAADFSDKFSEYLMQAVVSAQVSNLMEDEMNKFYKDWAARAEANKGTLTDTDVEALKEKWDDLVEQGLAIRDQASKITGYTGSTSQSATSGGWESMGQDTADELNGRFTALQIAGESIAQNMADTVSQMQSIVTLGISTNGAVLEIRNMMIMTNSYLEDVVKYAKLTYNDFGNKLDDMNKRLKEI